MQRVSPGSSLARRVLSLDEWAAMPEDEEGEIVDGELVEEEMPSYVHELVVTWIIHALRSWLGATGFVGASEAKFAVGPRRGRKPDVSVFLPGSRLPPRQGMVRVPPDIAVEVVSPTPRDERRDRIEKVDDYAAFGVRWYWLIDPEVRSFEIWELGADRRYVRALGVSGGVVHVPGCAGLEIDVDALWAEIDRLPHDA